MRTAISSGQWQPWTAVSALLVWHSRRAAIGLKALRSLPFTAEAGAKYPSKRQLHTTLWKQFFDPRRGFKVGSVSTREGAGAPKQPRLETGSFVPESSEYFILDLGAKCLAEIYIMHKTVD